MTEAYRNGSIILIVINSVQNMSYYNIASYWLDYHRETIYKKQLKNNNYRKTKRFDIIYHDTRAYHSCPICTFYIESRNKQSVLSIRSYTLSDISKIVNNVEEI